MKKFLKIFGSILGGIVVVLILAIAIIWGKEIATINSIKQVDSEGMLYSMQYKADYDLDDLISKDVDSNDKMLKYVVGRIGKGLIKMNMEGPKELSCTSFQAKKEDGSGFWYGRNYDYFKNPIMVTESHPKKGYASLTVGDMSFYGFSLEKLPDSFAKKALCLASVYAPCDGINEKGLCTSIMALPNQASQQETGKHKVATTTIMRLWLDRCATVQEAIDLVNTVDVRHDLKSGAGYHYMVADANGDCAVIEFDPWDDFKVYVARKGEDSNWMHVTNNLLNPKYYSTEPDPRYGNPNSHSWWRYATVKAFMEEKDGIFNLDDAQECLSQVHWKDMVWPNGLIEDTQYSNVYDQTERKLYMRTWKEYEKTYTFELK